MIVLVAIALLVLVALIGMDAAHDRYRRRWIAAVKLLELSDQHNDELRQVQVQMQVQLAAMSQAVTQAVAVAGRKQAEAAELHGELEVLRDGFSELRDLGINLAAAERERAAETMAFERTRREAMAFAQAEAFRAAAAAGAAKSGRVEAMRRMLGV